MSYPDGTMRACWGVFLLVALLSARSQAGQILPTVKREPSGSARVVILWPGGAPGALGNKDIDVPRLYCYPVRDSEKNKPGEHGEGRPGEHETRPGEHDRQDGRPGEHEARPGEHPDGKGGDRPEARGGRSAVILMPGGAYRTLVMEKEGAAEARWLNEHGVEAFVLEYRLGPKYHFPAPMQDAARAIRYVRSHATELGISTSKVGLWGFSAGGHLAGYLASVNDPGNPKAADPEERVSDRPDFVILSYARLSMDASIPRPTNLEALIGEHPTQAMINEISIDRRVSRNTAPSFIFSTTEDQQVNSLNATAYYDALKRANVPAELHIFERGPHGAGLGQGIKTAPELSELETLVANWMEMHGWMSDDR